MSVSPIDQIMDANSGLFKMKKFVSDASTVFNRAVQVIDDIFM